MQRLLIFSASLILVSGAFASPSQEVRQVERAVISEAATIQQQVEQLSQERQQDFQEWRQLRRETLVLEAHNQRLQEWNANLKRQLERIEQQLASLDATREELDPLLEEMASRLEGFIRHDLPFRQTQRLERVVELQELLQRVDVSQAEKLRQLLSTYRSEVAQGRELASSREVIRLNGQTEPQRVQLLRVGRIGLYYLTEDQQQAGVWSAREKRWLPLSGRQRNQVAKGLELADQRGLPELLSLPLSVPLREEGL